MLKQLSRRAFASDLSKQLLKASFVHAKTHGFNESAIIAACNDLGLPAVSSSLLQEGAYSLVRFGMDHWQSALEEELAHQNLPADAPLTDRLALGVKTRLLL